MEFGVEVENFFATWNRALALDPSMNLTVIPPFAHDGKGKASVHLGPGATAMQVLKKANTDRVKELVGVLNAFAAPFGTQEAHLRIYGVEGVDFNFDENGNPALTEQGNAEVTPGWSIYGGSVRQVPPALFDSLKPERGRVMYQAVKDNLAAGIQNPVLGLYSTTESAKGVPLTQAILDGTMGIIYGGESMCTYDQMVTDWRNNGGDQIRAEYEKALQDSTK